MPRSWQRTLEVERLARPVQLVLDAMLRQGLFGAAVVFFLLLERMAHADPPPQTTSTSGADRPRDVYREGKASYDAGAYLVAARSFAEADGLAPNDTVLELALASALKADEPVLGMTLVERAEGRHLDQAARAGREAFSARVGSLSVTCPDGSTCGATVDGEPWALGAARWITVGVHAISIVCDGRSEQTTLRMEPEGKHEMRPTQVGPPPPPPSEAAGALVVPPPSHHSDARPSPKWFWASVVATTVLGGLTVGSGLNVLHIKDQLASNRSDTALGRSGETAELRTNILLSVTGAAALAAATLGYFTFRSYPTERGNHAAR